MEPSILVYQGLLFQGLVFVLWLDSGSLSLATVVGGARVDIA